MRSRVYTESKLINGLKQKDNEVLTYIYNEFYKQIESFILVNGGSKDEAKDIFQDSLIIIYKKVRDNKLTIKKSLKSYLFTVCKNLWFQKIRISRKEICYTNIIDELSQNDFLSENEEKYEKIEKIRLFETHFLNMNVICRKLLKLFFQKLTMDAIAAKLNYKSADYAKARKYQCLKKLQRLILTDPCCKKFL